jgi:hypothetical protein
MSESERDVEILRQPTNEKHDLDRPPTDASIYPSHLLEGTIS